MGNILNTDLHQRFYQNLGRIFYAVAAADRVVKIEEIEALKDVVKKKWLKLDDIKDDFGTDSSFQIEIVFDWLDANKLEAEESFERFADFYKEHKEFFSPQIKEKILQASSEIASAFRGKNKSELVMLAKLDTLFNH